jgi:hypothetical protein
VEEAALLAEREDRIGTCMQEQGIRVERDEESGNVQVYPGTLDDTFSRLLEECSKPFPDVAPITRQEYSALYELNIEVKECLEARGVTVSEPPSREKWIDDSVNNPEGPWSPFDSNQAAFDNIEACPQPDLYHLYGVDPNDPDYQPQ